MGGTLSSLAKLVEIVILHSLEGTQHECVRIDCMRIILMRKHRITMRTRRTCDE